MTPVQAIVCAASIGGCLIAGTSRGQDASKGVTVELRGSVATVGGELVSMDAAGVKVKQDDRVSWLGWDVVRAVKGAAGAERWVGLSESAYRARSRLERGDFIRAEQELQKLSEQFEGAGLRQGPTPAMVAEGLVRARLARGYRLGAIFAWLRLSESKGESAGPRFRGAGIIDRATGLCVQLPPVFSAKSDGEALRASIDAPEWGEGEVGVGAWYLLAARFEVMGRLPEGVDVAALEQSAASAGIVGEVVMSRVGDEAQRKAARAKLSKRIEAMNKAAGEPRPNATDADATLPAMADEQGEGDRRWIEAWCHLAMGRSFLREGELAQRRLGVLELLNLPARFGDLVPQLAGLALGEAADELEAQGDHDGADRLRDDLASRFMSMRIDRGPVKINGWTLVRAGTETLGDVACP
jgi:hypothetical protein